MREARDVLRLKAVGLGKRKIAASLGIYGASIWVRPAVAIRMGCGDR